MQQILHNHTDLARCRLAGLSTEYSCDDGLRKTCALWSVDKAVRVLRGHCAAAAILNCDPPFDCGAHPGCSDCPNASPKLPKMRAACWSRLQGCDKASRQLTSQKAVFLDGAAKAVTAQAINSAGTARLGRGRRRGLGRGRGQESTRYAPCAGPPCSGRVSLLWRCGAPCTLQAALLSQAARRLSP
jgi:hypothetical protein